MSRAHILQFGGCSYILTTRFDITTLMLPGVTKRRPRLRMLSHPPIRPSGPFTQGLHTVTTHHLVYCQKMVVLQRRHVPHTYNCGPPGDGGGYCARDLKKSCPETGRQS